MLGPLVREAERPAECRKGERIIGQDGRAVGREKRSRDWL